MVYMVMTFATSTNLVSVRAALQLQAQPVAGPLPALRRNNAILLPFTQAFRKLNISLHNNAWRAPISATVLGGLMVLTFVSWGALAAR
jgi:hypothetical protein